MVFSRFLHWLRQPFPLLNDRQRIWRVALIGSLFVTFFLFLFQPFGLRPESGQKLHWLGVSLQYGGVTLFALLAWGGMTRLLPHLFNEEKWQVWKEILASFGLMAVIALANLFFTHFRYGAPISWRVVWAWQLVTWGVGIFPALYGIFHKQLRLMQRYAAEAQAMSADIAGHEPAAHGSVLVTLTGENQGETLTKPVDDLYYLAAADNYVQVFYREKEQLKSRMLRTTLRKMEAVLSGHPQFFRCHRTFLVNLDKVLRVSGNAQGYRLHLEAVEEAVPVSRNLNDRIRSRFNSADLADVP